VRASRALDLTDPATIRAVARRSGLTIRRELGQHLLIDRDVLDAIIAALGADGADLLEIGCGIGTLTAELARVARSVIAVDIDAACVRATRLTQRDNANVSVIRADARGIEPSELGLRAGWLATGNLPYNITGVVLSRLFEMDEPPRRGVFLVQREVAARLTAGPGDWSLATVVLRSVATIERLRDVTPAAFDPSPAVHSSVVRLSARREISAESRRRVIALARLVFQQRRKTLRHGLTHALGGDAVAAVAVLNAGGVQAGVRPGTLSLDEWQRLADAAAELRGRSS